MSCTGHDALIDVLQDRIIEAKERLERLAEMIGDWDDQEVRDEIERIAEALEG